MFGSHASSDPTPRHIQFLKMVLIRSDSGTL